MGSRFRLVVGGLVVGLVAGALGGCYSLPSLEGRSETSALPLEQARQTMLGQMVAPALESHPGVSGIHPLNNAHDAFAARLLLAMAAEQTLDVQYYIWHDDITGSLLFDAMLDAAERGVRVRILLDDTNTVGLDTKLAELDAHSGIEVRLFNPFVVRRPRLVGYITDFSRANRRMHNKSFTADNQATIIGGRNIGDEYFGAADDVLFADLDVLAIGPVVQNVSHDFDRYWASDSSYPAVSLLDSVGSEAIETVLADAERARRAPQARDYLQALEQADLIEALREQALPMEWAKTRMVSDDPAKGLGLVDDEALLLEHLKTLLGAPQSQFDLISPYFVPGQRGTETLIALAESGVDVRVLTNSLAATDVAAVHAGYAKRRDDLLAAGVRLYELKPTPGERGRHKSVGPLGSSASSLHAKTFAVDGERLFVGSFNFDPRSTRLNTELGFLIESPALANRLSGLFEAQIPANSYEVRLDNEGELYWLESTPRGSIRHDQEPETGFMRRLGVSVMAVLPIDWLL